MSKDIKFNIEVSRDKQARKPRSSRSSMANVPTSDLNQKNILHVYKHPLKKEHFWVKLLLRLRMLSISCKSHRPSADPRISHLWDSLIHDACRTPIRTWTNCKWNSIRLETPKQWHATHEFWKVLLKIPHLSWRVLSTAVLSLRTIDSNSLMVNSPSTTTGPVTGPSGRLIYPMATSQTTSCLPLLNLQNTHTAEMKNTQNQCSVSGSVLMLNCSVELQFRAKLCRILSKEIHISSGGGC